MAELIEKYEALPIRTLEDVVAFHAEFEAIHPFQDGNGRVGRLVMFKECLRNDITPFIITDEVKLFYYRGLSQWGRSGATFSTRVSRLRTPLPSCSGTSHRGVDIVMRYHSR